MVIIGFLNPTATLHRIWNYPTTVQVRSYRLNGFNPSDASPLPFNGRKMYMIPTAHTFTRLSLTPKKVEGLLSSLTATLAWSDDCGNRFFGVYTLASRLRKRKPKTSILLGSCKKLQVVWIAFLLHPLKVWSIKTTKVPSVWAGLSNTINFDKGSKDKFLIL